MCRDEEQAQAHFLRTILAIPILVQLRITEYPEHRLPEKMLFFPRTILGKPNNFNRISFVIVDTLPRERNNAQTEKTVTVYCLLFRIRPSMYRRY